MNFLTKTIAAGAFGALAGGAAAQETPALTIDKVAADLALPLGQDAFYFNRGVNVTIREVCEKDAQAPDTIRCMVDKRSLLGLMVDRHVDIYRVADGALSVESVQGGSRNWRAQDRAVWDKQRTFAPTVNLTGAPLGDALISGGLHVTQEGKLPQNDIFAIDKGGASVMLSSLAGVNAQRAFSMSVEFNAGSGIATASSVTQVYYNGSLLNGKEMDAERKLSAADLNFYDKYKAIDTGFAVRR